MVIDSSALISVLLGEVDAHRFITAINTDAPLLIAAPTWVEAAMVITARKGAAGFQEFEQLIAASGIEIIEFDQALAREAYLAWQRFGKGRHPASAALIFAIIFFISCATKAGRRWQTNAKYAHSKQENSCV